VREKPRTKLWNARQKADSTLHWLGCQQLLIGRAYPHRIPLARLKCVSWQPDKVMLLPPSSRKSSTTTASAGIVGRDRWRTWEWLVPTPCSQEPLRERMPTPPASGRVPGFPQPLERCRPDIPILIVISPAFRWLTLWVVVVQAPWSRSPKLRKRQLRWRSERLSIVREGQKGRVYSQPFASTRRSRCGSARGWPVLSSHFSPGAAPQVGQRILSASPITWLTTRFKSTSRSRQVSGASDRGRRPGALL